MAKMRMTGVLAALGTVGFTFAIGAYPPSAHAQTQGMDRRDDRRDTRQNSRDVKQACKAGDEKNSCRVPAGQARREAAGPPELNADGTQESRRERVSVGDPQSERVLSVD